MDSQLGMLAQAGRNIFHQRQWPLSSKVVLLAVLPIVLLLFLMMFRKNLGLRGRKSKTLLGAALLAMAIIIPVAVLIYVMSK